jgi:inorganic pyrophosphatase
MKVDKMNHYDKENDAVWMNIQDKDMLVEQFSIKAKKFIETYKRDLKIVSCIDKDYSMVEICMAKTRMEFTDFLLENIISKDDFLKLVD